MTGYFVFVLLCIGLATAVEFSCDNEPVGKTLGQGHMVMVTYPDTNFEPGQSFPVTIAAINPAHYSLSQFSIQARDPQGGIWGTWHTSGMTSLQECGNGYMLSSTQAIHLPSFDVTWIPPSEVFPSAIEFHVTVMYNEDTYHTYTTPMVNIKSDYDPHNAPSEFEEGPLNPNMNEDEAPPNVDEGTGTGGNPGENPNGGEELYGDMSHHADELDNAGGHTQEPTVDLHDPSAEIAQAREEAERRRQQIEEEEANSEGDWSIQEAEEERRRQDEYDWELREQERIAYEEEQKRHEIILWEIRDKEEHDAMMAQQSSTPPSVDEWEPEDEDEEEEIDDFLDDDAAGSSALKCTLLTLLAAFILTRA